MKKPIILSAICLLLTISLLAQKKVAVNEVDAVKAAIEKETKAFFAIDFETWINSWAHTPYAYWSFVDTTGVSQYEGWKAIEIGFTDYFLTSKPTNVQIERTWQEVRVYGTGAFARFKQVNITDGVRGLVQTEIRILEKDKTGWKIVLVGVLKR